MKLLESTIKTLALPCRYYRVFTSEDIPCAEENFHYVEKTLPLPISQTALVLVDVWNTHYIDSFLERVARVTQTHIGPLLTQARQAGLTIIHAPSPLVAARYSPAPHQDMPHGANDADWPPQEFRGIYRNGAYAEFGRAPEVRLRVALEGYKEELDIAQAAQPLPGEHVIHTGEEMQRLLAERQILHLVYAGFATNWCILLRDYGVIDMSARGYNIILIRDATTGIESHDTAAEGIATVMAIREVETKYGWSTTTGDFIQACDR